MRKALIIGIDDYTQCPLHGCCNDAEAINELLKINVTALFCISDNIILNKSLYYKNLKHKKKDNPTLSFLAETERFELSRPLRTLTV